MKRIGCALGAVIALAVAIWLASQIFTFGGGRSDSRALSETAAYGPLIVPVAGVSANQLVDSWHDARAGGARQHEALDIPAPAGAPVVAAMAGKVEKLFHSEAGGITIYVRSGAWMAYYAHLQRYVDGLAEGEQVRKGAIIGYVGDTGNAGAGNTHLHFALNRMRPGERWYQGTPVNPYPLLAVKAPNR